MEHLRYYILLNCITFLTFDLHNYNYNKKMRSVIYIIFYLNVSIKLIIIKVIISVLLMLLLKNYKFTHENIIYIIY